MGVGVNQYLTSHIITQNHKLDKDFEISNIRMKLNHCPYSSVGQSIRSVI
ncbi:MAG: hypothetical protein US04_C0001G0043 [Candidatus Nomurabacteria bacterium GW2011_GWD2_36_14]|nr:MAG: hypothetical protein UR97_C0007G0019 [Candidatus Nomurabacteria bacterium GW2011_GWE2_36_115]KKP93423.1 MAG: hypothetical protein US00_C0007G0045 [Candidatus Nomurabacteria bacterium GW2011_GWF2_36_126]KKP96541.1 MAG: hypothetical protein US04_C0001G0043 [Candidatus Nomurabacteria bacterium GW2011_GWD2_36_14]KKP99855.1 MAG: hypothetical protein US08_C0001G0538 [Candidatus Nomurabacteria bacterium GW2011_GWF2_36_19]KKQ05106.1 MAG: hypothetical protein US17_C0007G0019 [Candidatus Nomuraba